MTTTPAALALSGPCSWPVAFPGLDTTPLDKLDTAGKTQVEDMATTMLWNWTERQFGLCETVIRPCKILSTPEEQPDQHPFDLWNGYWGGAAFDPRLGYGVWFWGGCGLHRDKCSCTPGPKGFRLPASTHEVVEVRVDGAVLPPASYIVQDRLLVRVDGDAWPDCQDMNLPMRSVGTWEVTINWGVPVPVGGQVAAGLLMIEFARALLKDKSCALPERWQTITRQGVSYTQMDLYEDLEKGHTGIWLVDSWVASTKAPVRRGGRVYSVDVPRKYRIGG